MAYYNAKFAKVPRRPDNLHRPLNSEPDRLADVFSWRDERYVGNQLAFSYDRQRIILEENEVTRGLPGKYVDSYEYLDGRLEFRWKGVSLLYSVFDKDQRVKEQAFWRRIGVHQRRAVQGPTEERSRKQTTLALQAQWLPQRLLEFPRRPPR